MTSKVDRRDLKVGNLFFFLGGGSGVMSTVGAVVMIAGAVGEGVSACL